MATIPTVLYYFAILAMVEIDARKQGGAGELMVAKGELWQLTKSYWFHFGSLISIIAFMLLGFSPVLSVFWATILAVAVSALRSDTAHRPALAGGRRSCVAIWSSCCSSAASGCPVGVLDRVQLAAVFVPLGIVAVAGHLSRRRCRAVRAEARHARCGRHHRRAQRRGDLRGRRHHRRRRHADRPGAALRRHHHRLCARAACC